LGRTWAGAGYDHHYAAACARQGACG
jgi:hypothetical protein